MRAFAILVTWWVLHACDFLPLPNISSWNKGNPEACDCITPVACTGTKEELPTQATRKTNRNVDFPRCTNNNFPWEVRTTWRKCADLGDPLLQLDSLNSFSSQHSKQNNLDFKQDLGSEWLVVDACRNDLWKTETLSGCSLVRFWKEN